MTKDSLKCLALIKSLLGHYLPLSTGIIPVSRTRKNSPLKSSHQTSMRLVIVETNYRHIGALRGDFQPHR
jgi:hypothetical protein